MRVWGNYGKTWKELKEISVSVTSKICVNYNFEILSKIREFQKYILKEF